MKKGQQIIKGKDRNTEFYGKKVSCWWSQKSES